MNRIRSLAWFIVAAGYYVLARNVADTAANGLSSGDWFYLVDRAILVFLLVLGFAAMGYAGQRQRQPIREMGLAIRSGWMREFALGSAIGWAGVTFCALIIALFGALVVTFYTNWWQFVLVPLDLATLLVAALVEEVAFRGYPFQRLIEATNPTIATLLLSALFAFMHINNPGASTASTLVTFFAGMLFAVAYLRTRALWVGWGIHFAWNASMAVLFGLPLSGITQFSPVIASTAIGPTWLTGFDYGPEGSAVGLAVILALIVVTIYATRDLKHRYAQPVIVPGGIPVDIDAMARRQHEAAMGPGMGSAQSAQPQIVQISGVEPQPPEPASNNETPVSSKESEPAD